MRRRFQSTGRAEPTVTGKARTRKSVYQRLKRGLAKALGFGDDLELHPPALNTTGSFQTAQREESNAVVQSPLPQAGDKRSDFDERWNGVSNSKSKDIGRRTGGAIGFGLGAIVLLPFGPIGMCVCALIGLGLGILFGFIYDLQHMRKSESLAGRELKRLTSLVRFASDQISKRLFIHSSLTDVEYCLDILENVILEFRPFIQVAHISPTAQKKIRLLHSFLTQRAVLQCLWMYVNGFLSKWATSMTVMEFVETCRNVLQTLVDSEAKLGIHKPEERLEVILKVEEFLDQPVVRLFLDSQSRGVDTSRLGNLELLLARDLRHHVVSSGIQIPSAARRQGSGESTDNPFLDSIEIPEGSQPVRPFFRSFKDFMDFDLDLKHQLPITGHEAKFLYEKEAEALTGPGWELTVNRSNIKVLRFTFHSDASSGGGSIPPVLVRAYVRIPNTGIANVYYHIVDPDSRPRWDQNFDKFSLIPHAQQDECEILYCTINSPFGVTPRDFLQYRKSIIESDLVTIIMRSAVHSDKPPLPGFIRAESLISGYVIRQNGPDCDLFLMSQTDIKGLIPKWMVNMVAAKAPAQWIDNLVKSCQQIAQTRFGGDERTMNEFFDSYMEQRRRTIERFSSMSSSDVNV